MTSPTQITHSQLARLIGTPDCPVLIDVCVDEDFNEDPRLIPSAMRHPAANISALVPELKDKSVIIICQKGKKMSQGAAAILRAQGITAETLEGGNYAWRDTGLPLVPVDLIPTLKSNGNTLWVTRHRPKIDRVACPWLIRRFIDPKAKFLFVQTSEVSAVAEKFEATPFDVEDSFWTHRGEQCTFDTMIAEWKLDIEPLHEMSKIIRGADTERFDLSPQSAGLMALSLGLSRMYRDDNEQIEAGMLFYDALFRWARDAQSETHDWPHNK